MHHRAVAEVECATKVHSGGQQMGKSLPIDDAMFLANPYPAYASIRDKGPCVWDDHIGAWLIADYGAATEILASADVQKDDRYTSPEYLDSSSPLLRHKSRWILMRDGNYQKKMRGIMGSSLSRNRLSVLGDFIETSVTEATAGLTAGEPFEAIGTFGARIPFDLVLLLLGIDSLHAGDLRRRSRDVFRTLEPGVTVQDIEAGEKSAAWLTALLAEQLHAEPPETAHLLHDIRRAVRDEVIDVDDGVAALSLMFIAGHETTTQMIGNVCHAIAQTGQSIREIVALLEANPHHISEFWRYDGAVQNTMRVACREMKVGGAIVEPGDRLLILLGAANRDPAVFDEPDSLVFSRSRKNHLGFGSGRHYCIGATLAHIEVHALLSALARIGDRLVVDGPVSWNRSITFRGPTSLPIALVVE